MRIFAILVLLAGVASAQPAKLGDTLAAGDHPPEVVVLTFGVGSRIFEKFGHAAICLRDNASPKDPVCFNYGVTNFEAGGAMVWDFLRTQQKFLVDAESWSAVMRFYQREDRDIFEQDLPLSAEQARAIEKKLLYDSEPEHKFYVYDHFFDNCTTRIRDLVDNATGGKLRDGSDAPYPLTFRQMGQSGLAEFHWVTAVTDYILGRQLDDTPTIWQAMFHPDVLRAQIEKKLGVAPVPLYTRHGAAFPKDGPTDRPYAFAIALVFALPLLLARIFRRFERTALAWATFYLVFLGLLIWTLVAISSIAGVRWNEAFFVLMPVDIVLPFLSRERRRKYARVRVAGLFLVSALVAIGLFHQPLWIPILSAMMPLAIESWPWGEPGSQSSS